MPESVRVLHVMDHLGAGGIQTFVLSLIAHWQHPGFTHHVAGLHGPGLHHERFESLGVPPHYAAASRGSLSLPKGLRRIIRAVKPDIVHAYGVPTCLILETLRGWLGIPRLVTHLQSTYAQHPGQRYQDFLERACYHRSDHIIAVSRAVAEGLHRCAPLSIIPNGIDLTPYLGPPDAAARLRWRENHGIDEQAFLIGTVGRLSPVKDPMTLCRAFARCARMLPEAKLVLVGDGPLRPAIESWRDSVGLQERVVLTGNVPPDEVPMVLRCMDAFVLPSLREGWSLALSEAMATGTPCVAADFPSAAECLRDGVEGWIFPRGDDAALADCLRRVREQPDIAAAAVAAGRTRALASFSIRDTAAKIAGIYRELH